MNISTHSSFEAQETASELRISVETLEKLRSVLDPTLSFEDHDDIFPLDLGPIWDLESFSARKKFETRALLETGAGRRIPFYEWDNIVDQFRTTASLVLNEKRRLPCVLDETLLVRQSVTGVGETQIESRIHAHGETLPCFKETWEPPTRLEFIARDVGPLTVFVGGYDRFPQDHIDHAETEAKNERYRQEWRTFLKAGNYPDLPGIKNLSSGLIFFNDDEMIKMAEKKKKLKTFPAGHVIAFTDRTLHAGRIAERPVRQTWAYARTPLPHA